MDKEIEINPEQHKYEKAWNLSDYRNYSPGEHAVQEFIGRCRPEKGDTIIDFGCGTGRAALTLAKWSDGVSVIALDFVSGCLDKEVLAAVQQGVLKFGCCDLTKPIPYTSRLGLCTDVMEHVPEDQVKKVLENILRSSELVYFQICTAPDHFGAVIGETLHVTVKPHSWWKEQLESLGGAIAYEQERGVNSVFIASNWGPVKELLNRGVMNITEEKSKEQIRVNTEAGYRQITPHELQDIEVMILAGGPSAADFLPEIRQKRLDGMPLITVNGAYNWALSNDLTPSAQILIDGREFMRRFLEPIVPTCRYLLASQCHPSVLASVPKDQLWMFHSAQEPSTIEYINSLHGGTPWVAIPGGSTVMLRAFPLLRILGFKKFHVYGFDSCLMGDAHHAYAQSENDTDRITEVSVVGKRFRCTPWMASQAYEFTNLIKAFGDEFEMIVYGDGLISAMIMHGASLSES